MRDLTKIEHKREFLSQHFQEKLQNKIPILEYNFQELSNQIANEYNVQLTTWKDLFFASSDINPKISPTSFLENKFGFQVDSDLGQAILNKSFLLVLENFNSFEDIDEEEFIDQLRHYIIENNLHKKGFYYLIKKLKNLHLDDLQNTA